MSIRTIGRSAAILVALHCMSGIRVGGAATCTGGRYVVQGARLIAGDTAPAVEAIVIASSTIAIVNGCSPVHATLRRTKKGTSVRANWASCAEPGRKVRLKAKLDPTCTTMTGRVLIKKP